MAASRRARLARLAFLLGEILVVLVGFEILLRAGHRYDFVAESLFQVDSTRIWGRRPDVEFTRHHPDTGAPYRVINNNLAMHQHRRIDPVERPGEVRIGFFGDSMTENLRLPAPHAFTEVLDYLLRLRGEDVTVLNFGVDGYGPDQSYLYYRDSSLSRDLDHVVYVFVWNDVMNLYENGLFDLADDGTLEQHLAPRSPGWIRALGRVHLTYLLLDMRDRLRLRSTPVEPRREDASDAEQKRRRSHLRWARRHLDQTAVLLAAEARSGWRSEVARHHVALLRRLVGRWRYEVERAGGRFHVVIAPALWEADYAGLFEGYDVIDLDAAFRREDLGLAWKFEKDDHWNELGNLRAAVYLDRHLAPQLGLGPLGERELTEQLHRYYHAFALPWKPTEPATPMPLDPDAARGIRARYAGLEDGAAPSP